MTRLSSLAFLFAVALALVLAVVGLLRHSRVSKLGGLNITRSIKDRVFLGLLGFIFMLPTGYVLYHHFSKNTPAGSSIGSQLLEIFLTEIVLAVFLLSLFSFIWGVAAPRWLERHFHNAIFKFVLMLVLMSLVL